MVCPPLDWGSALPEGHTPRNISDLVGGYLSAPSGEIYDRYRLLSSDDLHHFYIFFENHQNLCDIMNKLQRQPFRINRDFLNYLRENYKSIVERGHLMPTFSCFLEHQKKRWPQNLDIIMRRLPILGTHVVMVNCCKFDVVTYSALITNN